MRYVHTILAWQFSCCVLVVAMLRLLSFCTCPSHRGSTLAAVSGCLVAIARLPGPVLVPLGGVAPIQALNIDDRPKDYENGVSGGRNRNGGMTTLSRHGGITCSAILLYMAQTQESCS